MSEHPDYMEGEVEVLDALIDLYADPAPDWTHDEWELRMYRAVLKAWAFYGRLRYGLFFDDWDALDDILSEWVEGKLDRSSMHQAFARSDRYLKRYYERFPHLQGGC